MNNPQTTENDKYTYKEYLIWNGPERYELVKGNAYLLSAPTPTHQDISGQIHRQLLNFLEGKTCKAYAAPFDVRLFEQEEDNPDDVNTVVQPDISIICDQNKIDEHGCKGAPEMIIEILSPSTVRHDRLIKMNLYQQAGVKELWLISPEERTAQVFLLNDGILRPHEVYTDKDIAKVTTLQGCFIEMSKVFP